MTDALIEPLKPVLDAQPARSNMRIDTVSLIVSSLLTGVLGLAFWGAAARMYPAEEVGIGSAIITSATMLSFLSILSLDTFYERFLPVAGHRTRKLVISGFLLVAAVALLSGSALVAFGPRDALFHSWWMMAAFPLLVMVIALFTLQDKGAVGLGVARWAAAKNAVHSVAKLVALVLLVSVGTAMSLVVAWGATAATAVIVLMVAMLWRCRTHPQFSGPSQLPSSRRMLAFLGGSWGITGLWAIGPLVVPLIVVSRFGAVANAHFAISWAIITALYTAVHLVISPYVAEVAANPDKVGLLTGHMLRMMLVVSLGGGLGLVLVGPLVLDVIGGDYRAEGTGLLYLAAIFVPLSAISTVYEGIARIRNKQALMVCVRFLSTLVVVIGSLTLTGPLGLNGIGWSYVIAEGIAALLLFVPVVAWIRGNGSRLPVPMNVGVPREVE